MAEWSCSGLQSRVRRFDSDPSLHIAFFDPPERSSGTVQRVPLTGGLAGGADEAHPLARLADYLGDLIAEYEASNMPMREMPAREFLRELMAQHGLTQKDLPEVGAQSVVSAVLSGKRQLNVRQIARLSARFGLPADAFMG